MVVRRGAIIRNNEISQGGFKRRNAGVGEDIARPRRSSVPGNDFEQAARCFGAIGGRDDAEVGCGRSIAGDANMKYPAAMGRSGAKAYVGGNAVEGQCAAVVDDDGNLGCEPSLQRCARQRLAQVGGDGACVENFLAVESGKRIRVHRNSIIRGNGERDDGVGKARCGRRGQSANLDAAAAGDLDNAIAETSCRRTERGERRERHRAGRPQPCEQSVAGGHRDRQAGAGATAQRKFCGGAGHAVGSGRSAARPESISLRRGCQCPRCRAPSSRSAMDAAACGFSRNRNARTFASAT